MMSRWLWRVWGRTGADLGSRERTPNRFVLKADLVGGIKERLVCPGAADFVPKLIASQP